MKVIFKALAIHAAIFCTLIAAVPAHAQTESYPSKTVRIVGGFPPGSATDVAARRVAQVLTARLGQSFIIENRPGASGSLAAEQVARAAPDGYTLYAGTISEIAINRPGGMKLRYDPEKDFAPTALLFTTSPVFLASNASGFRSLQDLANAAKAKPGAVSIGSVNAFTQVVVSLLERAAGVKLNLIYYKGTALAFNDVMASQVDSMVGYPAETMAAVSGGKANALAIVGAKRNAHMPETPTTGEAGFAMPNLVAWGAIFAPAGTPQSIVEKLNREIVAANGTPDIRAALARAGSSIEPYSVPEFSRFVADEIAKWDRLVKEFNIRLE
jgi:tripartite-type tricarboxylate transporter receptor subunit TctC